MSALVEVKKDNSQLLQFFWDLSKVEPSERGAAAEKLILAVQEQQSTFQSTDGSKISPNLSYSLDRLINGLASSNGSSRQGFAMALVEILKAFDVVTGEEFLSRVQRLIDLNQSFGQQDKRDKYFGRVFAILVLVRAHRVKSLSGTQIGSILVELVSFLNHKAWIREFVFDAICLLVQELPLNRFESCAWPQLSSQFQDDLGMMNIEQISLALTLKQYFLSHGRSIESLPHKTLRQVAHVRNLPKLASLLKESISAHPRIHSVWPLLINELFHASSIATSSSSSSSSSDLPLWQQFWNTVVDDGLMNGNPKHKFLGLQVLKLFAPRLASHQLTGLLTANLLRTILNHASKRGHALQAVSTHALESIVVEARQSRRANDKIGLTLALHLLGPLGDRNFDSRTKTQTVRSLLSVLDVQGVEQYIDFLKGVFASNVPDVVASDDESKSDATAESSKKGKDKQGGKKKKDDSHDDVETELMTEADVEAARQKSIDARRVWVLDQLCGLVRNSRLPRREGWIRSIVNFLLLQGFFVADPEAAKKESSKASKTPKKGKSAAEASSSTTTTVSITVTTPYVRQTCADRFFTVVSELVTLSPNVLTDEHDAAIAAQEAALAAIALQKKKQGNQKSDKSSSSETQETSSSASSSAPVPKVLSHGDEGSTADGQLWASHVLRQWAELEQPASGLKLEIAQDGWSDEHREAHQAMLETIEALQKKRTALLKKASGKSKAATLNLASQYRALELMFTHVGLMQLQPDFVDEATNVLSELQQCYKNAFLAATTTPKKAKTPSKPKKSKKSKKSGKDEEQEEDEEEEEEEEEEEPNFVEVLVDVMLSLLVKPSNMLRDVVKAVFSSFCDQLTAQAVDDLLHVLTSKDTRREENELFDMDEDEVEEDHTGDSDDEDDDDDDEDIDLADFARIAATAASSSQSQGKSSKDKSKKSEEDEDDVDDESDSEDLFSSSNTSEEMEKYDEALIELIRLRKEKRTEARELKSQSLHFKLRVLDLVEIFMRKQATNPLIWRVPLQLLEALRVNHTNEKATLHARLLTAYNKLTKPKEYPKSGSITEIQSHLAEMAETTRKAKTPQLMSLLKDGMAVLLRSYLHPAMHPKGEVSEALTFATTLIRDLMALFVLRKSKTLNVVFFTQLLARFPTVAWRLLPDLVASIPLARTLFLSLELVTITQEVLRHASHITDLAKELISVAPSLFAGISHITSHDELAKRVKNKRLREVLHVLQQFLKMLHKHSDAKQVAAVLKSTEASSLSSSLQNLLAIPEFESMLKNIVPSIVSQFPSTSASTASSSSAMEVISSSEKPVEKVKSEDKKKRKVDDEQSPSAPSVVEPESAPAKKSAKASSAASKPQAQAVAPAEPVSSSSSDDKKSKKKK